MAEEQSAAGARGRPSDRGAAAERRTRGRISPRCWLAVGSSCPVSSLLFRLRYRHAERIPPPGRCCWWPTTSRSSTRSPAPGWCSTTAGCRTSWPRSRCSRGSPARSCGSAGQIPVARFSADAHEALDAAKADLAAGNLVVIYPEGSVTRDPDWWPMQARTGVARLALTTDAVVLPVAQWGPQRVHDYHAQEAAPAAARPPRRLPGRRAGRPVRPARRGPGRRPLSAELLRETTDLIMARVRDQLAELRGEPAPRDLPPPAAARELPGDLAGSAA